VGGYIERLLTASDWSNPLLSGTKDLCFQSLKMADRKMQPGHPRALTLKSIRSVSEQEDDGQMP
jgi:hypothetical protein